MLGYAAGAALLIGLGAGWTVRDWKADADAVAAIKRADKIEDRARADVEAAAVGYEKLREQIGTSQSETRTTIREVYRDVQVPAECAVPDAALRVLDGRVAAANAAASGEPSPELP